jgi:hypothetical protein
LPSILLSLATGECLLSCALQAVFASPTSP